MAFCSAFVIASFSALSCVQDESYAIALVYSSIMRKAEYEKPLRASALLMVEQMNEARVFPKPVELVLFDNGGSLKTARNNARKIVKTKNIIAVVGYVVPECLQVAKPIYRKHDMLVITPTISESGVMSSADTVFRYNLNNRMEGYAIKSYITDVLKKKRVLLLYEVGYGYDDVAAAFQMYARESLHIVTDIRFKPGDVDFRNTAIKVRHYRPSVVVVIGNYLESGLISSALRDAGVRADIIGSSSITRGGFVDIAGSDNLGASVYAVNSFLYTRGQSEWIDNFNDEYAKLSGRNVNWIAFNTYESMGVVMQALRYVGEDRGKIVEYVRGLNSPTNTYAGLDGDVYFNKAHELMKTPVISIAKGRWEHAPRQFQSFDPHYIYNVSNVVHEGTNARVSSGKEE